MTSYKKPSSTRGHFPYALRHICCPFPNRREIGVETDEPFSSYHCIYHSALDQSWTGRVPGDDGSRSCENGSLCVWVWNAASRNKPQGLLKHTKWQKRWSKWRNVQRASYPFSSPKVIGWGHWATLRSGRMWQYSSIRTLILFRDHTLQIWDPRRTFARGLKCSCLSSFAADGWLRKWVLLRGPFYMRGRLRDAVNILWIENN